MRKEQFNDEKGSLARFNRKDYTLPEIWDALGRVTPVEVRAYDQGEDASVLVTQVCKGVAYGYPLVRGLRDRSSWYGASDTTAVRIPDGGSRKWQLADMPFDDLEKALFRFELNGETIQAPPKDAAKADTVHTASDNPSSGQARQEPKATRNGAAEICMEMVITFGKYRDKTVAEVMKKDPGYIVWAMENIVAFRAMATKEAAA